MREHKAEFHMPLQGSVSELDSLDIFKDLLILLKDRRDKAARVIYLFTPQLPAKVRLDQALAKSPALHCGLPCKPQGHGGLIHDPLPFSVQ